MTSRNFLCSDLDRQQYENFLLELLERAFAGPRDARFRELVEWGRNTTIIYRSRAEDTVLDRLHKSVLKEILALPAAKGEDPVQLALALESKEQELEECLEPAARTILPPCRGSFEKNRIAYFRRALRLLHADSENGKLLSSVRRVAESRYMPAEGENLIGVLHGEWAWFLDLYNIRLFKYRKYKNMVEKYGGYEKMFKDMAPRRAGR